MGERGEKEERDREPPLGSVCMATPSDDVLDQQLALLFQSTLLVFERAVESRRAVLTCTSFVLPG